MARDMPFPPSLARALAAALLSEEELGRLDQLHFRDAGHGYDAFGMHPSFIALGEAVSNPLYKRWFRVISRGHEHIPTTGPAVIAANHSGNIPLDGMMMWADILKKTDPPRVTRAVADHFVPALPFVGTLFARSGMVGGSRGNARALLEAGEMLMIFPEGTPGIVKPFAKRYQLQKFRVGHTELAIRHGAPVVTVGIIGAEEQLPQLLVSRRLGKPLGVPEVPIPASPIPLPVRYRIFYGPPIPVHEDYTPDQADDPDVLKEAAERVKTAVHELIQEGLAERGGRIFA